MQSQPPNVIRLEVQLQTYRGQEFKEGGERRNYDTRKPFLAFFSSPPPHYLYYLVFLIRKAMHGSYIKEHQQEEHLKMSIIPLNRDNNQLLHTNSSKSCLMYIYCINVHVVCQSCRSVVFDSAIPWTTDLQAPLSMGFSRQE